MNHLEEYVGKRVISGERVFATDSSSSFIKSFEDVFSFLSEHKVDHYPVWTNF